MALLLRLSKATQSQTFAWVTALVVLILCQSNVLLRTLEWIEDYGAHEGGTVYLDMDHMGAVGLADVIAIEPCPEIQPGPGRLVTGTFQHTAGIVLDLKVGSESKPIGVTPTHPFWSVSRQDWVAAGDLRIGERLETMDGTTVVESIVRRPEPETVYNIEVEGDHVYRVGESGVLVHNASAPANPCDGSLSPGEETRSTTTVQEVFQNTQQDKSVPITAPTTFQWKIIKGLTANLNRVHSGTNPDDWMKVFIAGEHNPSRIGIVGDTGGHVLPKAYGGQGLLQRGLSGPGIGNIIPQSPSDNTKYNDLQKEWNRVRKSNNSGCEVCIRLYDFDYTDNQHPLRPKSFMVEWWGPDYKGKTKIG